MARSTEIQGLTTSASTLPGTHAKRLAQQIAKLGFTRTIEPTSQAGQVSI